MTDEPMTVESAVSHLAALARTQRLCPRCHQAIAVVLDDRAEAHRALAKEISMRTLGGTPPPVDTEWGNYKLPPPASASDPNAPPHRREGMASSLDRVRKPA